LATALPEGARVWLKLELFQVTGSFKVRAALLAVANLPERIRQRGLVAVSAGNHAIAVAYAARSFDTTARVVMPRNANPARVAACRSLGADVRFADNVHHAFAQANEIAEQEERTFIHPFDGEAITLGTGTVAVELLDDVPDLDAVIVPIGGGGLCSGIAAYIKARRPECAVYGVEPIGADTMTRSLRSGRPEAIESVQTIADSLGAPHACEYSFSICRACLDEVVLVSDEAICRALALLFTSMKLAVEPAGAAATAALVGPLRERLAHRRVAVIVCGANIDATSFARYLSIGTQAQPPVDSSDPAPQ